MDGDDIDYDPGFKGMSHTYLTRGGDLGTKDTIKTRRNPIEIVTDEIRAITKTKSSVISNLAEDYMKKAGVNLFLFNPTIFVATVEYVLKTREKKGNPIIALSKTDLALALDVLRYKKLFDRLM
jgi:hypothetical protein